MSSARTVNPPFEVVCFVESRKEKGRCTVITVESLRSFCFLCAFDNVWRFVGRFNHAGSGRIGVVVSRLLSPVSVHISFVGRLRTSARRRIDTQFVVVFVLALTVMLLNGQRVAITAHSVQTHFFILVFHTFFIEERKKQTNKLNQNCPNE